MVDTILTIHRRRPSAFLADDRVPLRVNCYWILGRAPSGPGGVVTLANMLPFVFGL